MIARLVESRTRRTIIAVLARRTGGSGDTGSEGAAAIHRRPWRPARDNGKGKSLLAAKYAQFFIAPSSVRKCPMSHRAARLANAADTPEIGILLG